MDETPGVRAMAAWALGCIGSTARSAVPALAELMNDTLFDVSQLATAALARVAPDGITRMSDWTSIEQSIIRSRIIPGRYHPDKQTTINAVLPAIFIALESYDSSNRVQALRILNHLPIDILSLLPTIQWCLNDDNYLVRLVAMLALNRIGLQREDIQQSIRRMLVDANHVVRTLATELIERHLPRQ
jgi:HEAT repeat protein